MEKVKLYERAVAAWGQDMQLCQLQEECGEMVAAISHFRRRKKDAGAMMNEAVDVEIMLEQFRMIVGDRMCAIMDKAKERKLKYLEQLLDSHDEAQDSAKQ